ncbi:nucleotide exchange factor Sil1 [Zeugodacus cucurbitae]|uniref:Nucleotide exchange factor SIL1 n=1 Tax=Zeugodacus cucurbitae TaxID=28588 RepID=A0A0A1WP01_ZEUCU|nr:nucleotide exchange factor Sil1 [Zeugodacus cucurbitae]
MKMKLRLSVVLLLVINLAFTSANDKNKTFVATTEWQEIDEGQGIPAGLHVRINLKTGKKEAKLLDSEEEGGNNNNNGALLNVEQNVYEAISKESLTKHKAKVSKKLSDALQNLPKGSLSIEYSPEKLEQVKRDFKTYGELKSFKDLQKGFHSDGELITKLIDEYKNISKEDQERPITSNTKINTQLRILEDLDYLVHQIDNALWFIDKGGLDKILLPLVVNETNINLRMKAIRVLGALTLNNPKAQIKVFEKNIGGYLAQILISSVHSEELSSALYAFGSLLRKFPLALQRILSTSGTQALVAVLAKECELKVKAKSITLISDIIVEKRLVLSKYADSDNPLAAAQYAELNLQEWLQSSGFCETVDGLVSSQLYELLEQPDLTEYFVIGLENTAEICESIWSKNAQLRHTLLTIKNRYMQSKDEFRGEVAQQIETLVQILYSHNSRDEL